MGDIREKLRAAAAQEKAAGKVTRGSMLGTDYAEPLDEEGGTQLHWAESGPVREKVGDVQNGPSKKPTEGGSGESSRGMGGSQRPVLHLSPEALAMWADAKIAKEREAISRIPSEQPAVRDPNEPTPPWLERYMRGQ